MGKTQVPTPEQKRVIHQAATELLDSHSVTEANATVEHFVKMGVPMTVENGTIELFGHKFKCMTGAKAMQEISKGKPGGYFNGKAESYQVEHLRFFEWLYFVCFGKYPVSDKNGRGFRLQDYRQAFRDAVKVPE